MVKESKIISNLKTIFNKIKEEIISKDKGRILRSIKNIILIVLVAIIIKVPFIFIRTLMLDSLNGAGIGINTQNIIAYVFEIIYVLVALVYIYNRLKKCYINKNEGV